MKRFKKISLISLSVVIGLILTLSVLTYIFEDKVKAFAIEKINQHLTAEITAESIDFTIFQRFPNASLKFKNVLLKDKKNNADTIIYAEDLYLKMNIWDLLDKKYDVKSIEVNKSVLNLLIDEKGDENYIFWKSDTTSSEEEMSFTLEQVDFYKTLVSYKNKALKQSIKANVDFLNLKGAFNEEVFSLEAKTNLLLTHFISSGTSFVSNQRCILNTELEVNSKEESLRVNIGDIKIADLDFIAGGYYNYGSSFMELVVKGNEINIKSLFSIFPEEYFEDAIKYKSKGILTFDARIKGRSSRKETPVINAEFEIKNGALTESNNNITLSNLNLLGFYSSYNKSETTELKIKNFSGVFEDGNFSGFLHIENLSKPSINLQCKGNLNLNTLYKFVPSKKLKALSGNVTFNAEISGNKIGDELNLKKSDGTASFSNLNIEFTDNNLVFNNINADFELKRNHAYVSNLSGQVNKTKFTIDGYFRNFLPYLLLSNEKLVIEADVWADNINLKEFLESSQSNSQSNESSSSPNVDMSFRVRTDKLTYGQFEATNIKTTAQIIDQNIFFQGMLCNTSRGSIHADGELLQLKNGSYVFNTTAIFNKLDVSEFFKQLDNFGQTYLTNNNIKGLVDGDIEVEFQLDKDFNILTNSILSSTNFKINKGELLNVPILDEMAKYMATDWKIKTIINEDLFIKKVKHIKFKDLSLSVLVKNKVITIPYTNIESDLIDINGEATHDFDDNIDYKFNFRLRDILVQKPESTEEFQGYEIDDQTGIRIFGQMIGTVDDPEFKFDMLSKKEYNEIKRQQEKENVKALLKDEFGLFKNDTSVLSLPKEEEQKAKFIIDWEELDKEEKIDSTSTINNIKQEEKEKEKKKNERMQKLMKKIGAEENKEEEVKFKIDNSPN